LDETFFGGSEAIRTYDSQGRPQTQRGLSETSSHLSLCAIGGAADYLLTDPPEEFDGTDCDPAPDGVELYVGVVGGAEPGSGPCAGGVADDGAAELGAAVWA
jgi:hypothetical protein